MVKKGLLLNLPEGLVVPYIVKSPFFGDDTVICRVPSKLRVAVPLPPAKVLFFFMSYPIRRDLVLGEPASERFLFSSSIVYHFFVVTSKALRSFIS